METTMVKRIEQKKAVEILRTLQSIFFGFPSELSQATFEEILNILEELQYYMCTEFNYIPGGRVIVRHSPIDEKFDF